MTADRPLTRYPILLVEDNRLERRLLEKLLTDKGYPVTCVENGRKALDLYRDRFFPIVLTDWLMPELDGLELCRRIRSREMHGYVYIVLMTSKADREAIVDGLESGADDFVGKPLNHAELLARLNTGIRILDLERSLMAATEEIRQLSISDPLTGAFNRGYLTQHLPSEISRIRRYGERIAIVMFDIDHFKQVNDTHGHQAGDQVLKEIVARVARHVRKDVDWVARYGGEEFIVVLPETGRQGALVLAERLREVIASSPVAWEARSIAVTASFGVAAGARGVDGEICSAEELINRADQQLYSAKHEGRNRVAG